MRKKGDSPNIWERQGSMMGHKNHNITYSYKLSSLLLTISSNSLAYSSTSLQLTNFEMRSYEAKLCAFCSYKKWLRICKGGIFNFY
jgi:hypothetical protein